MAESAVTPVLPITTSNPIVPTTTSSDPPTTSTTLTSTQPTTTTSSIITTPTSTSTSTSTTSSSTSTSTTSTDTTSSSTTTSSSATTTATSSSTSSSATTSSETSSTASLTVSSSSTTETLISTSNGVTSTVIVTNPTISSTASQSSASDATSGSKSFFDNKGAVAGVFTVVGLVGLVLFIVLATTAIRRRRAKKFDEEVAAAAAEASASPRYPFDDYDDPAPGGGYGMGAYSDQESHGTLSQAPLAPAGESYNMSEFSGYNASYGAGAASTATGVGAGAAGIGASRSIARRDTSKHSDYSGPGIAGFGANPAAVRSVPGQTTPYNAFAGVPGIGQIPSDPYDPYTAGNSGIRRNGSRGGQLLDAAGLAIGATGAGDAYLNRGPSQSTADTLARKQSQGTSQGTQGTFSPDGSAGSGGAPTQESYAAHYQPSFRPDEHQYQPLPAAIPATGGVETPLPNPFVRDGAEDEEAYGAESYFPAGRMSLSQEESRMSIRDEEDYGRAGRTLKVANE